MGLLPSISLVTCSYQQGRFLEATIQSVLAQEYLALEYLIVDGGSTDGSAEIIRRHERSLAFWASEKDRGQTDALSKGFARSTGEIMGWLCSDDVLLPGALRKVGEFFAAHPNVECVYGDSVWIDSLSCVVRAKKEIPWSRFVYLFDHNYLPQPSVFWRRSLFDRVGGLDERWNLAMDSDLWLRFSTVCKLHHLPQYLSCMRTYPEQKTRLLKPAARAEDEALRRREAPTLSAAPRWPVKTLARVLRVCHKAINGAYGATVPEGTHEWLSRVSSGSAR